MRSCKLITSVAVVLLLRGLSIASAQTATPTTDAASQPVQQHLTATVKAVKGLVQYRQSADQPWQPCTVGLVLSEGAEFQTGPRSNVQLLVPPEQTITLDRFGSMSLLEAIQSSGKFTTNVGLKRGRVRYNIEAPGIEHESTVSSPNGTLAVRDTSFALDDEGPFPPEAYRLSGTVEFSTANRTILMGGAGSGNIKAVGDQSPAQASLTAAVVDPSAALTRTPAEAPLVATLISHGAVFEETFPKTIPIVSGGSPPSESEIEATLPGNLSFVLTWDGNANLDLRLAIQKTGEILYPQTGINTSASGGLIPFNDIGGPQGGVEYAYWKNMFPKGLYFVQVNDISGVPVDFTAQVFEHRQLDSFISTDFSPGTSTPTFTGSISAGQVRTGQVLVGEGNVSFSSTSSLAHPLRAAVADIPISPRSR